MPGLQIEVSGAIDLAACNGVYQAEEPLRNGRKCFSRPGGGAIYFDGSFWKICQGGSGQSESGWNFSQTPRDGGLLPPFGRWNAAQRIQSEMARDYSLLDVKVVGAQQPEAKAPTRIVVSGCSMPNINGTFLQDAAERNGRLCFSKVDGPGALYFDRTYWKLCQSGTGSDESGWNFSQLPTGSDSILPPEVWVKGKNIQKEKEQDYTGLKLTTLGTTTSKAEPGVSVGDVVTAKNAKVGMIVVRGPDWKWGDQDGSSTGTVTEAVDGDGWVSVVWHKGSTSNKYRVSGPYDLRVASDSGSGANAHDGVQCDVCGVCPIKGIRFTKLDSDWDVCCEDYSKLAPPERREYYGILDSRIRVGSHVAAHDAQYGW
jgi:hypothetical protein